MFIVDIYSFIELLLEIPQLHIIFFVILHGSEVFVKFYSNFSKVQLGWFCTKFWPHFEMLFYKSETKQVDDISLHSFTIGFDCLFENSNVSIMISFLHVCWVLKFWYGNLLLGSNHIIFSWYDGGMNILGLSVDRP